MSKVAAAEIELIEPAEFDSARLYRYALRRTWDLPTAVHRGEAVLWVMLNPSTADERVLDPTLRRCIDYTDAWGYTTMLVGNVFAWRATDPHDLRIPEDPVGPDNAEWLERMAFLAGKIVLGWGGAKIARERRGATTAHWDACEALIAGVRRAGRDHREVITCLSRTKDGWPGHPLYLRKSLTPEPYFKGF